MLRSLSDTLCVTCRRIGASRLGHHDRPPTVAHFADNGDTGTRRGSRRRSGCRGLASTAKSVTHLGRCVSYGSTADSPGMERSKQEGRQVKQDMIGFFYAIDNFITNNRQLLVTAAVLYWLLIKPILAWSVANYRNPYNWAKYEKLQLEIEKLKREARQSHSSNSSATPHSG